VVGHDVTNLAEGVGGPRDPAVLFGPEDVVADLAGLEVERARRPTGGAAGPPEAAPPGSSVSATGGKDSRPVGPAPRAEDGEASPERDGSSAR
jgi:hypothetical protein